MTASSSATTAASTDAATASGEVRVKVGGGVEPTVVLKRGSYAAVMLAAAAIGASVAAGVGSAMGGDSRTVGLAVVTVALASVMSVLPALMGGAGPVAVSKLGYAILGGSMGRTFGVMVAGLLFQNMHDLNKKAFWLAAVSGAGVVLVIEVVQAMSVLGKGVKKDTLA